MLFVAAAAGHFAHSPQGRTERLKCTVATVQAQDQNGFGSRNRE